MTRSEFFKSLWNDPEFKKRQSEIFKQTWTRKRRDLASQRMKGHKHSEATIRKISESNIRTWHGKGEIQ